MKVGVVFHFPQLLCCHDARSFRTALEFSHLTAEGSHKRVVCVAVPLLDYVEELQIPPDLPERVYKLLFVYTAIMHAFTCGETDQSLHWRWFCMLTHWRMADSIPVTQRLPASPRTARWRAGEGHPAPPSYHGRQCPDDSWGQALRKHRDQARAILRRTVCRIPPLR